MTVKSRFRKWRAELSSKSTLPTGPDHLGASSATQTDKSDVSQTHSSQDGKTLVTEDKPSGLCHAEVVRISDEDLQGFMEKSYGPRKSLKPSAFTLKVTTMRHEDSESARPYYCGDVDPPLTPEGLACGVLNIEEEWKENKSQAVPHLTLISPSKRTMQTGELLVRLYDTLLSETGEKHQWAVCDPLRELASKACGTITTTAFPGTRLTSEAVKKENTETELDQTWQNASGEDNEDRPLRKPAIQQRVSEFLGSLTQMAEEIHMRTGDNEVSINLVSHSGFLEHLCEIFKSSKAEGKKRNGYWDNWHGEHDTGEKFSHTFKYVPDRESGWKFELFDQEYYERAFEAGCSRLEPKDYSEAYDKFLETVVQPTLKKPSEVDEVGLSVNETAGDVVEGR